MDQALARRYGHKRWEGPSDPLAGLVATILSQNTTAVNSRAAFESLVSRFRSWEEVAAAPVAEIAAAIRRGGLANRKAALIKGILEKLRAEQGLPTLDFLAGLPDQEALDWLTSLDGVGPKTAACVLMFCLGRQVFPVDTHVHRITTRLGWLPPNITAEAAHRVLADHIPPKLRYQLHLNLVAHGRQCCRARNPTCQACPITPWCAWLHNHGATGASGDAGATGLARRGTAE